MENKTSILKFSTNPGLLLGIVLIFIAVLVYIIGLDPVKDTWINYINYLVMGIVIFFFQKQYRDSINEGFLSYGQAIKIGVTISFISAILLVIYSFIFTTYIEPDFNEQMLLSAEEQMVSNNPELTDAQIDMAIGMARKMTNPMISIPFGILASTFVGLILSLVTGLFVKKSDAPL